MNPYPQPHTCWYLTFPQSVPAKHWNHYHPHHYYSDGFLSIFHEIERPGRALLLWSPRSPKRSCPKVGTWLGLCCENENVPTAPVVAMPRRSRGRAPWPCWYHLKAAATLFVVQYNTFICVCCDRVSPYSTT